MARCPRCGKKFKDDGRVLRHMTQPKSTCKNHILRLVRISRKVNIPSSQHQRAISPDLQVNSNDTVSDFDMNVHIDDNVSDSTFSHTEVLLSNNENELGCDWEHLEDCAGAAAVYGRGTSFMDQFDLDKHARYRLKNVFYPFASKQDWEVASWLARSNLSLDLVDEFFSLELIRNLPISFHSARKLRGRIEMLPKGPEWHCKPWATKTPTKSPIQVYYRDAVDCLQDLYRHPLLADKIKHAPFRLFSDAAKLTRVYTEWLSGDVAWNMQKNLPLHATLLGTILSSDKTNISAMTGNRTAHPLLISLANIDMECRMQASNHAFTLLAILPDPNFIAHKNIRGVIERRLFHECVDFVIEPLKIAARLGVMMSDPVGNLRYCFTPLATFIADTPEETLVAGVGGNSSPFTMAFGRQLGDPFRHEPRTSSTTLAKLQMIRSEVNPDNIEDYATVAATHRLNGVDLPFWRDWHMAEPSTFLTPEPLHHFHKFFWDHETKWCINVLGAPEIDFRFSVLQPRIGYRHFKEGISKLKQVTGREHRNLQRHMISVIAGGAAPRNFVISLRALMDFRYLSQAPSVDEIVCQQITVALKEFHDHKTAIIKAGGRRGKKRILDHFNIPKLELFQSVEPSIRANGANIQWSADVTEHAHITEIKRPAETSNNQNYEEQICRHLDRLDKVRRFELATSIRNAHGPIPQDVQDQHFAEMDTGNDVNVSSPLQEPVNENKIPDNILDIAPKFLGSSRIVDYFQEGSALMRGEYPDAPKPFRTFSAGTSAFHLNREASFRLMTVDSVAETFSIPDLRQAIAHYLQKCADGKQHIQSVGGRRPSSLSSQSLPFNKIQVWTRVRIQTVSYFDPQQVLPPETLEAEPPSTRHPSGRYNSVLVNVDPSFNWPRSGISGHIIAQIRLIMRLVPSSHPAPGMNTFLAYVQRFDIIPQPSTTMVSSPRQPLPDPVTGMYLLKRSTRSDGTIMGDIVPLSQCRVPIEITPRFTEKADPRLTKCNSTEISSEFWLDKYFHKELFWGFHLTSH